MVTQPETTTRRSGRFLDLDPDKLRGGYYTSSDLTRWIVEWAIRTADDRVLEPSCGDGAFLSAAADQMLALGVTGQAVDKQLVGVEIIETEASKASAMLKAKLDVAESNSIDNQDFFGWWDRPDRGLFDAIVGNPPFIRYQTFPEPHRGRAMEIMRQLGLKPNRLTNVWVPFVVASAAALAPGGRMGFVLPAELLQVTYAAQLRTFLVSRFRDIHVVACNELFFNNAEQEVVVLLADGALGESRPDNKCQVTVSQVPTRHALVNTTADGLLQSTELKTVQHEDEKWLKYFLSQREIDLLRNLRTSGAATTLNEIASVDVGVVTGKNEFFVINEQQVDEWDLREFVVPLVARAAHLSGALFAKKQWSELWSRGERVFLLQLGKMGQAALPPRALDYVKSGEVRGDHLGYKCSIREPWYSVPSVWVPDAFMFRQIHDFPRIVANSAGATCTDTIHRMRMTGEMSVADVVAMCFTSLTAASAEVEGRSYGGGVLELEPTEAERLLLPAGLHTGLPLKDIDCMVRAGKLTEAIALNDDLILRAGMGLSKSDLRLLRSAWDTMRARRYSRGRVKKPSRG